MNKETEIKLLDVLKSDPAFTPNAVGRIIRFCGDVVGCDGGPVCNRILSRVQAANVLRVSTSAVDVYARRGWLVRVYFPGGKRARGFTESSVLGMKQELGVVLPKFGL